MRYLGAIAASVGAVLGFASISWLAGAPPADDHGGPSTETPDHSGPADLTDEKCRDPRGRVEELRKMQSQLESRIEELVAADAEARFLPPRNLSERFSGPAVRNAVEEAIRHGAVAGRVDEVDCSAFPCLVLGHYADPQRIGALQRELRRTPAYADDIVITLAIGKDPSARDGVLFGAIAFPRDEPRAAEILEAVKRRRAEAMDRRLAANASGLRLASEKSEEDQ